jgi:hypothetical protein
LSEKTGFGYDEMMGMRTEILLALWNTKKKIFEERAEEQPDYSSGGQLPSSSSMPSMPNIDSIMSSVRSSIPIR